jgi:hypothetical protein
LRSDRRLDSSTLHARAKSASAWQADIGELIFLGMRGRPLRFHLNEATNLRHEAELWLAARPTGDAHMFAAGAFEMLEVLLESRFIELRQELGLNVMVEAADVVDELTFVHKVFTFTRVADA